MSNENCGRIRIDENRWEDQGKIYNVLSYHRRNPESTAVELELECDGKTTKRVVAVHAIEWVEDNL